jgi:thioredoxin reductase
MKYDYDLIVIGGGAAGLVAATGGGLACHFMCVLESA